MEKQFNMKFPSLKKQKNDLGYEVTDSLVTDLYSTDEECPEWHRRDTTDDDERKSFNSSFQPSSHCTKCRGNNKILHIEFEINVDGI
jgi:hypothetical protein